MWPVNTHVKNPSHPLPLSFCKHASTEHGFKAYIRPGRTLVASCPCHTPCEHTLVSPVQFRMGVRIPQTPFLIPAKALCALLWSDF
jgi:hypothetical protein